MRQDPFESYDAAPGPRADQTQHKTYIFTAVGQLVRQHLSTFKDYPVRQKASTLSVEEIVERVLSSMDKR